MTWDELLNQRYMIVNKQLGTVVVDHKTGDIKTFASKDVAEKYIEHRSLNTNIYVVEAVKN